MNSNSKILNQSFPAIRVLNLDRSKDRLKSIGSKLEKLGLSYERFQAIDGQREGEKCRAAVDVSAVECYMGRSLIDGEIACALGHLGIWKTFESVNYETILVLEDDAVFDESLLELPKILAELPDDWDLCLLSTVGEKSWWQKKVGNHTIHRYFRPRTFAIGYVVHRRILKKRDQWDRPIRFAFDMWRFWIWRYHLAIYCLEKKMVDQPKDQISDISGTQTRVTKRVNVLGKVRGLMLRCVLYPYSWIGLLKAKNLLRKRK